MAKYTQDNRPIAITTPLGKDVLLLEKFTGTEAVSQLFRFELNLLTETDTGIAFDQLLGQSVSVVLRPRGLTPRDFHGIISRVSEGQRTIGSKGSTFLRYRAEMVPSTWLLTRGRRSRIFQQLSVPDILKQVLGTVNVTYEIQGTFEPRDYCIQYRESDFDFASRLMEEEGIFYFFKHTNSSHTMVLADTAQSFPQTPGPESIIFDELVRGVRDDERIYSWLKSQEIRSGKETLWDYCFEMPDKHLECTQTIQASLAIGTITHKMNVGGNDQLEIYDYPGGYAQRFDGVSSSGGDQASALQKIFTDNTRTVGIRMQEEAALGINIDAESDCRQLVAGHKFTLDKHFNANGSYVLLQVNHEANIEGAYTEEEPPPMFYRNTFRCIPDGMSYRPPRKTPKPRMDGTQTAIVVGPQGEEIYTDKYGRVKVQFHWHREGTNDASSSCWMRVATLWAGKQWGMIHIPRIGQEVIVSFEEGDPDQPIIVGSVFNANNMPPYTLPDNKTQSGIKSRSSLKGEAENFNELRFEDKKDAEEIYFHAEKDFTRIVQNNDVLQVGYIAKDGEHKSDDGSQTIKIYKDRTETLETGNETVTITKGTRTHTVQSDESLTIKEGNQTITIEKGNRTESIKEGNETVAIAKGSRTHSVKSDDSLTIEGKRTTAVTGDDSLTIKTGNHTIKVSVGKSSLESATEILLTVGGNSIKIDPSGITIKGIAVTIEGSASLEAKSPMSTVKGDGVLTLKGGVTTIN